MLDLLVVEVDYVVFQCTLQALGNHVARDAHLYHYVLVDHLLQLLGGIVAEVADSFRTEAQNRFSLRNLCRYFPCVY